MFYPKVFIIILSWNRPAETLQCLQSVSTLDYHPFEIVVVDNGSADNSVRLIRDAHPYVTVIENGRNVGYTGGNNVGMAYAIEHGAQYVWLLNNDTIVQPSSLRRLIIASEQSPDIGLASPVIYDYNNPNVVQCRGYRIDFTTHTKVPLLDDAHTSLPHPHVVLWGTALLIRTDLIKKIGYLREDLFAYWEDDDYSVRSLMSGHRNIVESSAAVYHKGPAPQDAYRDRPPHYFYYMVRNQYLFWKHHLKGYHKLTYIRYYLRDSLRTAAQCAEVGSTVNANACLEGLWAGLWGTTGPWTNKKAMPTSIRSILSSSALFWIHLLSGQFKRAALKLFKGPHLPHETRV